MLLSGGVSVGDHDHVGAALRARADALMFYKVRMKPGKPVIAAQCGGCVVLGLPGNPASTMVSFELFARPVIRAMQGARRLHRSLYSAPCQALCPVGGSGTNSYALSSDMVASTSTLAKGQATSARCSA